MSAFSSKGLPLLIQLTQLPETVSEKSAHVKELEPTDISA
jgi:hypothetical protein